MSVNPAIFRAYDIRGVVNKTLTVEVVRNIGQAVGTLYPNCPRVAVGRDGRLSSPALAQALCEGLVAAGRTAIDIGQAPTPVLYYATHRLKTGAGIVVTGSHNPPDYNGLKLVMGGETLFGDAITAIYERIEKGALSEGNGEREIENLNQDYVERISEDVRLARPLRVAIDCGNGAAGPVASRLFTQLGCELIPLYCDVDGNFPNHHPNPSDLKNLKMLIETVRTEHLDLGLAFDGDGDRLGVIDNEGNVIWADRQMMLFAADVLEHNPGAEIIYDVKSSKHLHSVIASHGGMPRMWKTGHSLIKAKMKETGALLAGEMSGHIFFKERWYGFDDGLYAGARLLEILSKDPRPSSEIFAALPNAISTPEIIVDLGEDGAQHAFMRKLVERADFSDANVSDIDGLRVDYPCGWGLVRASNTTPSLVIRFEADDESGLKQIQQIFRNQILAVDSSLKLPF
ncbi:MAG TPA: phosphomannomutase/phosphoglucomutase [Gammaproteobacteria bacterium]|nr:phosphomannomutase/phosphoglucomutase [Gammaproteobacteria bacterium]